MKNVSLRLDTVDRNINISNKGQMLAIFLLLPPQFPPTYNFCFIIPFFFFTKKVVQTLNRFQFITLWVLIRLKNHQKNFLNNFFFGCFNLLQVVLFFSSHRLILLMFLFFSLFAGIRLWYATVSINCCTCISKTGTSTGSAQCNGVSWRFGTHTMLIKRYRSKQRLQLDQK